MRKNIIDLFFDELSKGVRSSTEVIITGAAAGSLMGNVRQSIDIDFEIRSKKKVNPESMLYLQNLIEKTGSKLGIATNYSEDISRWSMIDYLDYRKTAVPYKKLGKLELRVIAAEYWTIGKMTRYLAIDIQDILKITKKKNLKANELIHLWARALNASPLSLACGQFRDHVTAFLKMYGKRAWGKSFDADKAVQQFQSAIHFPKIKTVSNNP